MPLEVGLAVVMHDVELAQERDKLRAAEVVEV
jgi:hypothetical protein